jgi:hypothetical protein
MWRLDSLGIHSLIPPMHARHPSRVAAVDQRVDTTASTTFDMQPELLYPRSGQDTGEKVTGTFCLKGPEGASHKRCLSPFLFNAI